MSPSPLKLPSPCLINLNGELLAGETAQVAVFDRSYLYGDSLYEVCRTYSGKLFLAHEHLARLAKSADLCRMTLSQTPEDLVRQMQRALDAFHERVGSRTAEAYVRLVVSRGAGKIGFGLACVQTSTLFTVIVQPLEEPTAEQFERGFHLQTSARLRNDPRALDPAMKSGNYLNSLLAYLDAAESGFDDAILCNADGHVTEGTTFNVGYIRRGILATPPLDIGILDGLTRRKLLAICARLGLEAREVRFPVAYLAQADEAFLCSTVKEIFPVTKLDGRKIGDGHPGPWTRKLAAAFRNEAEQTHREGARL